jgi:hypothetical protein
MMKNQEVSRVSPLVTASELAAYAYCPEQWRLEHGLKRLSGNVTARAQGTEDHTAWQTVERTTTSTMWWAMRVVIACLVLLQFILWCT